MKNDDEKFPLLRFDFRPPACDVIVFPLSKRTGKIRHVAGKLLTMEAPEKERIRAHYWNERCKDLTAELQKRGQSKEQIAAALEAFRSAVTDEMNRLAAVAGQSPRPAEWDNDGPKAS